jgi:hypothetical protein
MDYRNAAGRNWGERPARRRPVELGAGTAPRRMPESLPPAGQLEHRDAPGRNWTHNLPQRRPVQLARPALPPYPVRERGGGDHDHDYHFAAPSARWTFPFSTLEFGRLLSLRGRIADGELSDDRGRSEPRSR